MTAWQSMFAAGACTVSLSDSSFTPPSLLWSGVLGLNQSSPSVATSGGAMVHVAVDGSGNVSTQLDSGTFPSSNAFLTVAPNYDVSLLQTQISNMRSDGNTPGGGTISNGSQSINISTLNATQSVPSSGSFSALANPVMSLQGSSI